MSSLPEGDLASRVASAREALIAELIGQLDELVKRVEVLPETLDNAREAMNKARWELHCQVDPLHHQMAAAIEQSKDIALKDIRLATYRFAAISMEKQTEAMKEVAREVVGNEIRPSVQELANALGRLAKRVDRQWRSWLTHGATVLATAVGTTMLLVHFFGR
jgi:HAMP domain-containing protein